MSKDPLRESKCRRYESHPAVQVDEGVAAFVFRSIAHIPVGDGISRTFVLRHGRFVPAPVRLPFTVSL